MVRRAGRAGRREAIITFLLVITGIVLAICLFAAGLLWRGKPRTKQAVMSQNRMSAEHG